MKERFPHTMTPEQPNEQVSRSSMSAFILLDADSWEMHLENDYWNVMFFFKLTYFHTNTEISKELRGIRVVKQDKL